MKKQLNKYSAASKKRMAAIPKAELSAKMRELGRKRQLKMSEEERRQHGKMMVNKREEKRNGTR